MDDGRRRVVIEAVQPQVDCGRFPIKRVAGENVRVEASVFCDGHDAVMCSLLVRKGESPTWQEFPMQALGNDRWRGEFTVRELGRYLYTVEGWVDPFQTWREDLQKRIAARQDVSVQIEIGRGLIASAAQRAASPDRERLGEWADRLRRENHADRQSRLALDAELARLVTRYPDRRLATRHPELAVTVDRRKARCSAWYELFPRSCSPTPGQHGTLRDTAAHLDYVASMGFDVLYLPPIHPIGRAFRKGKNNTMESGPADVGSPWAIGAVEGGHKAIHPQLGTLEDFRHLIAKAKEHGMEVALDVAFQCTPDHPYVADHPDWFRHRPDGSIQYAENPPKKYQDIFPLNFETEDWRALWEELTSVLLFWIEHGVRIFRVDNPHTKPFAFWEWLIGEVKSRHPDVILLSEAFTRPQVMYRLSKLGFTQSYTYFTWRNTKQELTDYFSELTQTEVREFFVPNLWPNTPDILPEYLQYGGRPAFMTRLVLAATLGANYGIYGPAYELCENEAIEPGSEEYRNSEKYEIKVRDRNAPGNLKEYITRVNRARRENPALQGNWSLRFHPVDNDLLLCYSKTTDDRSNAVLVVVNLDPRSTQSGWVTVDLAALGLNATVPFQVHDLLNDHRHLWQGAHNYVELDPRQSPAHLFRIRRQGPAEQDFDDSV